MKPKVITLCLGSNCSEGVENILKVSEWIKKILYDTIFSSIYETPAIGGKSSNYHNRVIRGKLKNLTVDSFNKKCKQKEIETGRDERSRKLGIVPIDIDIVICDEKIVREKDYIQSFFRIGFEEITELQK